MINTIFIYSSVTLELYIIISLFLTLFNRTKAVFINIGNSFKNYYLLPNTIWCNYKEFLRYKCSFIRRRNLKNIACIYNGNRKFPSIPNCTYNMIITTEKLSQVQFMKFIGEGNNKYYKLAIDYRLFSSKYHISRNIFSYYNLTNFLEQAESNFGNISLFTNRKNIVYIQRVHYKKRQEIVKKLMKYFSIDSYGNDLNNREWPKNISKRNKIEILKQYKFCIAIENSVDVINSNRIYETDDINNDYVTEKLTDCLLAASIPIYFGPKNINTFLPDIDAIINIRNFNSIYNLSDYIKKIMKNYTLLHRHLKWINNASISWRYRFTKEFSFSYCKICNKVYNVYNENNLFS